MTADLWSALAAWLTALVAIGAAAVAVYQLREARKLREEQAQPYVVAFMERSEASSMFMELVVKNFGLTAAKDIHISADPPLQRSRSGSGPTMEDLRLFDRLALLVPGQEWRTFWDSALDRPKEHHSDRHTVTLTYTDMHGHEMPPAVMELDWAQFAAGRRFVIYGIHQVAKSLLAIEENVKQWGEPIRGGLRTWTRDGEAMDKARRRDALEFEAAMEAQERQRVAAQQHERDAG